MNVIGWVALIFFVVG
jgi:hypothetical protein